MPFPNVIRISIPLTLAALAPLRAAQAPYTDFSTTVPQRAAAEPAYLATYTDPDFHTDIRRVTDTGTVHDGTAVHTYSELQAWNANQGLILLMDGTILDAHSFKVLHRIDYGYPAQGMAPRWSPVDSLAIYYLGTVANGQKDPDAAQCADNAPRLMRYRLSRGAGGLTGKRELVRCFPEYKAFEKDASWQEMSDDGSAIALVGDRPDGRAEAFVYDLRANAKSTPLLLPLYSGSDPAYKGTQRIPDWAGMSPSGKYLLVMWSSGTGRYQGLEAYDRSTAEFAGQVTTGSGHGDVAMDAQGHEYYVYTNANNPYFLSGNHYIVRASIPKGVVYGSGGAVDANATVSSGGAVTMLSLDWNLNTHISCRDTRAAAKGCVLSTYGDLAAGWVPLEKEVAFLYLDSKAGAPHGERLAHHQSDFTYVQGLPDAQCGVSSYWVQPHASLSPDGSGVLFSSSWGKQCRSEDYLIDFHGSYGNPGATRAGPSAPARRQGLATGLPGGRLAVDLPWAPGAARPARAEMLDARGRLRAAAAAAPAGDGLRLEFPAAGAWTPGLYLLRLYGPDAKPLELAWTVVL